MIGLERIQLFGQVFVSGQYTKIKKGKPFEGADQVRQLLVANIWIALQEIESLLCAF